MGKRKVEELSDLDKVFVKKNYLGMSVNKMSKELEVSYYRIRKYMIRNNLTVPKKRVEELSDLDKVFIKKNFLSMSINKMSEELEVSYYRIRGYMIRNNLTVPKERVEEFRLDARWNVTIRKKVRRKPCYDTQLRIAKALGYNSVAYAIADLGLKKFNRTVAKWGKAEE